jgi:hypothetical protein
LALPSSDMAQILGKYDYHSRTHMRYKEVANDHCLGFHVQFESPISPFLVLCERCLDQTPKCISDQACFGTEKYCSIPSGAYLLLQTKGCDRISTLSINKLLASIHRAQMMTQEQLPEQQQVESGDEEGSASSVLSDDDEDHSHDDGFESDTFEILHYETVRAIVEKEEDDDATATFVNSGEFDPPPSDSDSDFDSDEERDGKKGFLDRRTIAYGMFGGAALAAIAIGSKVLNSDDPDIPDDPGAIIRGDEIGFNFDGGTSAAKGTKAAAGGDYGGGGAVIPTGQESGAAFVAPPPVDLAVATVIPPPPIDPQ